MALFQLVDGRNAVTDARGKLKIEIFSRLVHFLRQRAHGIACAAADEIKRLLHGLVVFLLAHVPAAWGTALLDIVVEARAAAANLLRKFARAGRQTENLPRLLHGVLDCPRGKVWADILCAVIQDLLRLRNARPVARCHLNITVPLIVL